MTFVHKSCLDVSGHLQWELLIHHVSSEVVDDPTFSSHKPDVMSETRLDHDWTYCCRSQLV